MKIMEIVKFTSQKRLDRELKLMLLLSQKSPSQAHLEDAQSLINRSIRWDYFQSLAIKHAVAPLLSEHLKKLANIPENLVNKFKGIYGHTLFSNMLNITETEEILEGLNKAHIKAIPLKGPVSSEKIFGNIGLYPSSDIDILVKPDDIDKAANLLQARGYQLINHDFRDHRNYYLKDQYHITFSNGKHAVELHWNLLVRFFSAPPLFWWQDCRREEINTKTRYLLSPEKELLYLAFRLFSKGFFSLKYLLLFAETYNYHSNKIDSLKMFEMAKQFHMSKVLTFACLMANELLNMPFPASLPQIGSLKDRMLYNYGKSLLFAGEDPQPIKKIPLIFMRDDFKGAFSVLLRRIFPPAGEVAKRYQLAPSAIFLPFYYLANPFILIINRHKNRESEDL